ncbi:MAG: selenocysteine-specific translation elongation factor [Deltaproteobacteria bacterium]|nr:selenocysteine-specific translation elongation factor [Deltaproteobacteria bacterium]MDL1962125.1 selenocysteine-specific translation elongation factor [Deltaproteobacteria bacterium]
MDTKTIIIGTAGHIDHGKTALVKALTGIDTDRLKEEKERGITIELGFAHLSLLSGQQVGVVDVPGHERFVKNMVAGAMGMDLVVLVVAADEGVMPQTTEHLEICRLLGVKKGLIVLTKKDLVEKEWLEMITEDVSDFVSGTFLEDAPVLAVSSVTGDGLYELLSVLEEMVSEVEPKAPVGPYRLPVDRVFSVKGFGTVVTGTSISGQIRLGDEVSIYPKRMTARIRGIQIHGKEAQEAHPGMRTALNLQGIDRVDVNRGDVIATPGSLHASYLLDLNFLYLASSDRPLRHRSPVRFHAGTAEVIGRVLLQGDELVPGSEAYIQIMLKEPVAVLSRDHYVIRSYSPIRTIGGGEILHPVPRRRKRTRPALWAELDILAKGEPADIIGYHLERAGVRGLSRSELAMRSSIYGKRLARELDHLLSSRKVVCFEGEGQRLIHGKVYEALKEQALDFLETFHNDNPLVQGLSKEELRSRLFPTTGVLKHGFQSPNHQITKSPNQRLFQMLLSDLVKSGKVAHEKDLVRLSSHHVTLGDEEKEIRRELELIFKQAGFQPPFREDALGRMAGHKKAADTIFDLMVREGILVRLKEDLYFHHSILDRIKDMVIRFIKEHGELGINEFRDLAGGLSRKYMIPLLEYLDNQRVTIRIGDKRKLRGGLED